MGRTVLSGSSEGRRVFSELVARTPRSSSSSLIFLDFQSVAVATASFLRESVVAYRDFCSAGSLNLSPVVANPSEAVTEELDFYLRGTADCLWVCTLGPAGEVGNPRILGALDPALAATVDLLRKLGTGSASQLAAEADSSPIGMTGWNNRLASLSSKGILREWRDGRTKIFSLLLEER
jgi:hypothetical protein